MPKTPKRPNSPPTKPRDLVAIAPALPSDIPTSPEAPPLEAEQPHKVLARANARHAQLTAELRQLKADWASENIRSQQTHQAIATSRVTFVETHRRELQSALMETQAEIAQINKHLRERKAERQGNGARAAERQAPSARGNGSKAPQRMPLGNDPEFSTYFVLAAKDELAPALYAQVERVALAMIRDAKRNGVD
jgi:hypothetical protein